MQENRQMTYQFRQIPKPILEVGDRVEYTHPILDLGDIVAIMLASIIAIEGDKYQISIPHGTQGEPKQTETETTVDRLKQLTTIDNPHWLSYQIEQATKFSYEQWNGRYLYDKFSEQYFESREEMLEWHEENKTDSADIPNYCFNTKPTIFAVDSAEDQVEYWFEEDENTDYDDFEGMDEFQASIDNFNSMNRKKSYRPDYSIVINFDSEVDR
jgi:hypothetical protein